MTMRTSSPIMIAWFTLRLRTSTGALLGGDRVGAERGSPGEGSTPWDLSPGLGAAANGSRPGRRAGRELRGREPGVRTTEREELVVVSALDDPARLDVEDDRPPADGRQAV